MADIGISDKFSVQPELLFSLEGADIDDSITNLVGVDPDTNISFIRVPILAKYKPAESFAVVAGPQLGFVIDEADFVDTNAFNFGLAAGVEYFLSNGLGFEGRYNFGISNINDTDGEDIQQNSFQLGLAYKF